MLKLSVIELFLRLVPEGFIFIFAGYAFSKTVIHKKRLLISSMLLAFIGYLIRLLPISFGVHSILNIIVCICLLTNINKIQITKAIPATIFTMILGFISEAVNVFIIHNILNKDLNIIFNDSFLKILYGIPSLIILGCIIYLYYIFSKRKKNRNVSN